MDDRYEILRRDLLSDLQTADPLYQPTHYWRVCSERLLGDLDRHGLETFRSWPSTLTHFAPTYFLDGMAADEKVRAETLRGVAGALPQSRKMELHAEEFVTGRNQALADYRVYVASDVDRSPFLDKASESDIGAPSGQFEFDGRKFSRSMLNYLLGLIFAKRAFADLSVQTVVEIGGGFGTLGEILAGDERNGTFYVDVDIPPTALFSTYYLQQLLGEDRVLDYSKTRKREELDLAQLREEAVAAVLCPWQLPLLKGQVDLFVNSISFQEMEPYIVENYLAEVSRLESRFILLRNIREGKQIATEAAPLGVETATVAADYDRFLPRYELAATNVIPFGFPTVDGFHSEIRLYRRNS